MYAMHVATTSSNTRRKASLYRGAPAAHSALMAGDAHVMFDATGSALPQSQSGRLRALGVTGKARLRVLPDVPLIGDVVPGYAVTGWLGIGVPRGSPAHASRFA